MMYRNVPKDLTLEAVMNTVLDGLIIIDEKGTIRAFNPSAMDIFGYTEEEVLDQNVKMLMPDPYHSEHDDYLSNYKKTKNPKVIGLGREVEGRRKNGERFSMELGVNEMHIDGVQMFVGTVRDITDRKRLDKAITKYILALQQSNQALDDFAYIASHDLKEPLRGLSNNALFLKEDHMDILPDGAIQRIDRIIYLSERMEQVVDDLLYFSRLSNQELAIQAVSITDIIQDIISTLEGIILEKNVHISCEDSLPVFVCDRVRISEVFRNLITNAIKYNDKTEKLITIGYDQNKSAFFVKDNGIGIKECFYDDVFRLFKRLNDENDDVKGNGVGLTFVKRILDRHNGQIWIDSTYGEGTTFFFTIPQDCTNYTKKEHNKE